ALGLTLRKCSRGTAALRPNHATHPSLMGYGRTRHLEPVMDLMRRHDLLRTAASRPDRVARLRYGHGRLGRRIASTAPGAAGGQRKVEPMIASRVRKTMSSNQRRTGL